MSMRRYLSFAFVVMLQLAFVLPFIAHAASMPGQIVTCNGAMAGNGMPECDICDLAELAQNLLNTSIFIVVFLAALSFAKAGFKYMVQGNKGDGKDIATNVTVGMIAILGSWLVIDTLMKTVLGGDFGPWNNVCAYLPS